MKAALPLLALLLLATAIARADLVIVQKVEGGGQSGEMTVKVSGDKVRADLNPNVSTITDVATGDVTTLMHTRKAYLVIPSSTVQGFMTEMTKTMQANIGANASGPPAPAKATGRTDTINGYKAAEYTFANPIMKATYWMAAEFPNAKAINDALEKFRKGNLAEMARVFTPDFSSLPGVPVRTEIEINKQKIVTDLVSVKEQPIDAAEYQVPPGYTEMQLPAQD